MIALPHSLRLQESVRHGRACFARELDAETNSADMSRFIDDAILTRSGASQPEAVGRLQCADDFLVRFG
jgi:hypothetical protein